jgi:hypothetical protein
LLGALSCLLYNLYISKSNYILDTLYINLALLYKQSKLLSEGLLSYNLDNRFERLILGDLG